MTGCMKQSTKHDDVNPHNICMAQCSYEQEKCIFGLKHLRQCTQTLVSHTIEFTVHFSFVPFNAHDYASFFISTGRHFKFKSVKLRGLLANS